MPCLWSIEVKREVVQLPPLTPLQAPRPVVEALMRRRDAISKSAAALIVELSSRAGVGLDEKII